MTGFQTSRVFDAQRKCKTRLLNQTWPTVRGLAEPKVALFSVNYAEHLEVVHIVPQVGDDGTIVWKRLPGGRDEEFDLDIVCTTAVFSPAEEDDALTRIEALADVVQRAFYNDLTNTVTPLDVNGAVKLEGVGQVTSSLSLPVDESGEVIDHTKLIAQAVVTYRLQFRI